MRNTIGELISELSVYSNLIETNTVFGFPFIRAYLSGRNNTTKAIIYVIQTSENTYASCDNEDELLGHKYFPTGSISKPFISEAKLSTELFGGFNLNEEYKISLKENMNLYQFIDHLHSRLWYYDIINFNPSNKKIHFAGMGFTSKNIKNIINNTFRQNKHPDGKIKDLIDIVIKENKAFGIEGMKEREVKCIYATLSKIGIIPLIKNNQITEITFERRL